MTRPLVCLYMRMSMCHIEENNDLEESNARIFFLSCSLASMVFKLALAKMMTMLLICFCICLAVVSSILVIAVRTALMGTVVIVRCKRERKKNVVNVRLSSPPYTHAYTYTSYFATNSATSFICYREEKKGMKKKKEKT